MQCPILPEPVGQQLAFEAPPARRYVHPDPWADWPDDWRVGGSRLDTCGTAGPILLGTSGLFLHERLCWSFECESCGPERSMLIKGACADHFHRVPSVWLFRITSSELTPFKRKREVVKRGRTIVESIRSRGGEHVWVDTDHDGYHERHLFASVDYSTERSNRGYPPRQCQRLTPSAAASYLDLLLQHGIVARGSSRGDPGDETNRGWSLDDGERARAALFKNRSLPVGHGSWERLSLIASPARQLYESNGGTQWPDGQSRPSDLSLVEEAALYRQALVMLDQQRSSTPIG